METLTRKTTKYKTKENKNSLDVRFFVIKLPTKTSLGHSSDSSKLTLVSSTVNSRSECVRKSDLYMALPSKIQHFILGFTAILDIELC